MEKDPDEPGRLSLSLVNAREDDERPEVAVYVLDRANNLIHTARADEEGNFDLPRDVLRNAHQVAVGPAAESFHQVDKRTLATYRASNFVELARGGLLEFDRRDWLRWHHFRRCISGSVKHCFPWFVLAEIADLTVRSAGLTLSLSDALASGATAVRASGARKSVRGAGATAQRESLARLSKLDDVARFRTTPELIFPRRCVPVCEGLVEVYRRTCCCRPWVIDDPRLPGLLNDLEILVRDLPPLKWPPPPPPDPRADPAPFEGEQFFFKSGALDQRALNAPQDLATLRALPRAEVPQYVQARPWLLCWPGCGAPVKVGQGFINPDARFNVCWNEPFILLIHPFCHREYAFVVKQNINGATVTIYDGLAAGEWFHDDDDIELVSHHRKAVGCYHDDFPVPPGGAYALLEYVGGAGSYRLKTPDATGWDRVAAFDPD
ncbi:MAG TPA: hypothetical protein VGV38_00470, partial [Pyrinomonadaceae bacterium]|nr:hypothetical protein [Pyrinomonadaceae bacterium]